MPCHHATEYLSNKGIEFQEINIRQSPEAIRELQRLGVFATPALIIGETVIAGFNREEIDAALSAATP